MILTITLLGYTAAAKDTGALLRKYYAVKNALVDSDVQAVRIAIGELQSVLGPVGSYGNRGDLSKVVNKLAVAGSIDKQRAVFNAVSTTMWQIVKGTEHVSKRVYYQYCPMENVYWLSDEPIIRNPYFGASMLTCGKVSEIKQ